MRVPARARGARALGGWSRAHTRAARQADIAGGWRRGGAPPPWRGNVQTAFGLRASSPPPSQASARRCCASCRVSCNSRRAAANSWLRSVDASACSSRKCPRSSLCARRNSTAAVSSATADFALSVPGGRLEGTMRGGRRWVPSRHGAPSRGRLRQSRAPLGEKLRVDPTSLVGRRVL